MVNSTKIRKNAVFFASPTLCYVSCLLLKAKKTSPPFGGLGLVGLVGSVASGEVSEGKREDAFGDLEVGFGVDDFPRDDDGVAAIDGVD